MAIVRRQEIRCDSKSYCAILTDIKYGQRAIAIAAAEDSECSEAESSGRQLNAFSVWHTIANEFSEQICRLLLLK